jgi:hypothetical protein
MKIAIEGMDGVGKSTIAKELAKRNEFTYIGDAIHKVFSLKAGITKVRMYMWIEGQDVDCEDDASGSNIAFDLQLTVKDNI